MAEPNYYELIGVDKNATLQEIRANFRQKVLAEHPDKGGDPKRFALLNKAYNVLTDQEKRRRYDATGRTEQTAEEEFAASFGGGRLSQKERPKDADAEAVVNISDRVAKGPAEHEDGFSEWLRQRDQSEMVLTDKDFMKSALFNAAEMATKINHDGPVQHVLGSPKTDAYGMALGGAVQVQVKPRSLKKSIDHDEVLVRMLATPVDDSVVYAELNKGGICLGETGVGRVEQVGSRCEHLKQEDCVLVLPKPTKFTAQRPIGTARTLLICQEEDLMPIQPEILEELTPEQICLTPTIVCAYILLEAYGAKLKPGDSVLLNAAHMSASGCSLLQLCKLLKLKPLCLLGLPGAPKNQVKGEYGSKSAWQDAESRAVAPPTVRAQYERISEWLINMGADEVFPDAVSLLRWRDRNQRMLPKLGLDGISTRNSAEQLIHCLQTGDKDAQLVVYGHGVSQPIDISPPLLAAWGGSLIGFSIRKWVHSVSANAKKMMTVMENVTKLVRANKFTLDTVLYKVGEDAISDAFARAADASDSAQVVLIFPTLQEEMQNSNSDTRSAPTTTSKQDDSTTKKKSEDDYNKMKQEWLDLLFSDQSVAAKTPEGPLPIAVEAGNKKGPSSLVVWIGDSPKKDATILKDLPSAIGSAAYLSLAWVDHPCGEEYVEFDLTSPQIVDGSFYLRDRHNLENSDLDMLHDVEMLGRSMVQALEPKLAEYRLDWKNVVIAGFGKGAGIALYAALLRLIPEQVSAVVLFSPIVLFPTYFAEKIAAIKRSSTSPVKMFTIWGNKDLSTPPPYRQALTQALRKAPEVHCTPDTLPDGNHSFDAKSYSVLTSLLPLCLPR